MDCEEFDGEGGTIGCGLTGCAVAQPPTQIIMMAKASRLAPWRGLRMTHEPHFALFQLKHPQMPVPLELGTMIDSESRLPTAS